MGFSLEQLLSWSRGSRALGHSSGGSRAREHRLNNCGLWDIPGSRNEPMSLALAGGFFFFFFFFTTEPPGKSDTRRIMIIRGKK